MQLSISATWGKKSETWVKRVAGVLYDGICSANGSSVNERRQVGCGKTNYFWRCLSDSKKLVPISERKYSEIAGGTVQKDGFNDATVQKKKKMWFDWKRSEFAYDR